MSTEQEIIKIGKSLAKIVSSDSLVSVLCVCVLQRAGGLF